MNTWRKKMHPETRAVLAWMMANDVLSADIARAMRVHNSAVSHFLAGRIASAGLRRHFIDIGCPERLMGGIDRLRGKLQQKRKATRRPAARKAGARQIRGREAVRVSGSRQ